MITRATAVSGATALILGWMGFTTMNDEPSANPNASPPPPQRVSVRLLGPVSDITGAVVPTNVVKAGRGTEFFQIDEPSAFEVALSGGKLISLPVKTVFVTAQSNGEAKTATVVDVTLLPLPKSVEYRDAIAKLRSLMRAMGIEPDDRMRKQMAGWPDDVSTPAPGFELDLPSPSYRTGVDLSESVAFEVVVRPAADGGWFLALTLAAAGDARRAVWDPNFKPTPKPAAEEKGKEPVHPAEARAGL